MVYAEESWLREANGRFMDSLSPLTTSAFMDSFLSVFINSLQCSRGDYEKKKKKKSGASFYLG